MKKHIFALLALASTVVGASAESMDFCGMDCCDTGSFYVGGFAGVNFLQNIDRHCIDAKFKTGFAGGVSLGYRFQNNIRIEAEFAYRRNVLRSISFDDDGSSEEFDFHGNVKVQTYAGMGNFLYDFDLCSEWVPYLGFGLGYAQNRVTASHHHLEISGKKSGFAYQGIAGIGYQFCPRTILGLEYRYFHAKKDIRDHSILLAIRQSF